jgi:hypothetical protein
VSQPEMQPGGRGREEDTPGGAALPGAAVPGIGSSGVRSPRAGSSGAVVGDGPEGAGGDLTAGPFPHGDWGEPAERLDELYRWVESGALRTAQWYLADRVHKRLAARALRAGTVLGALAGAVLTLLDLTGVLPGAAGWGYLSLLLGGACLACDRYFGVTSGWMRHVATASPCGRSSVPPRARRARRPSGASGCCGGSART